MIYKQPILKKYNNINIEKKYHQKLSAFFFFSFFCNFSLLSTFRYVQTIEKHCPVHHIEFIFVLISQESTTLCKNIIETEFTLTITT